MTLNKKLLAQMRELCAELSPEDGLDPKILRRQAARQGGGADRRQRQLCGQIGRVLSLALAASPDPILQSLLVVQVAPDPSAPARLQVTVCPADPAILPSEALAGLRRAGGWLRGEVACAIQRRRVPELAFAWQPPVTP